MSNKITNESSDKFPKSLHSPCAISRYRLWIAFGEINTYKLHNFGAEVTMLSM